MHRRSRWWMVCTNASVTSILSLPLMNACCAVMRFVRRDQRIHPDSYENQSNSFHPTCISFPIEHNKFSSNSSYTIGENYYYEPMINLYTHILSYIHYDCINNFSFFFFVKIEDIIKRRWVGLKRLLGSRQKKKLAGILNAKSAPTLDLGNFRAENILNTHTSGNKTPSYTLLSSFLLLKSSLLMFIWSYYEGFARKKIRLCRLSRKIHVISRCIGEDRATCPSSLRLLSFGACSREEAQVSNPLRINQVFVELLRNLSSFSDILLSW